MNGFEYALLTGGVVAIAGGLIAAVTVAPDQRRP